MVPAPLAGSGNAAAVRDTATTGAPALAKATAIPRPRPRLAPTTTVVLPDKSRIIVLSLCVSTVSHHWLSAIVICPVVIVTLSRICLGGARRAQSPLLGVVIRRKAAIHRPPRKRPDVLRRAKVAVAGRASRAIVPQAHKAQWKPPVSAALGAWPSPSRVSGGWRRPSMRS